MRVSLCAGKPAVIRRRLAVLCFCISFAALAAPDDSPREKLLLDFGWKFHLGNEWGIAQNLAKAGTGSGPAAAGFSDSSWRKVNLPHDWAVELPFDQNADGSHGFKPVGPGFPATSVAWYRRTFDMPKADSGKRLWLEFDGAFRDCSVFVNGWYLGRHEGGYNNFRFDITDVANCGGKNVIAVKVDASEVEGWFYEGAGIYRHVWLEKAAPLAVAPDGTFVFTRFNRNVPEGPAEVHVQTRVANEQNIPVGGVITCEIFGPAGRSVAATNQAFPCSARGALELEQVVTVASPELWSPETPKLYRLVTTIESGGKVVDRTETEFGIRTVGFDAEKGFLLNGKPYVLKGTCNHQDHAGVGAAMPDHLQYFRVSRLKEMGSNAYRTSHNPPTPELLEACDRLGMLVMDECRQFGSSAQNAAHVEGMVRRDRNHPSVAIWSIGNEEFSVQTSTSGARAAETVQALVKTLDPTRPVTYAANLGNTFGGIDSVIEVRGWNYHIGADSMDAYHRAHPEQPNVGTEQGSTVGTRGIYANDKERGYVSAYDDNAPKWANTAEAWWPFFAERPWLSGGFVWTGFDYRGEPTPYWWPCVNSHFGILDTCGFPKDNFYYYQAWWSDAQVLRVVPHWNWPGKEGQEIDVRVFSNCEEVELLLNGRSFGKQQMKKNSHLQWKIPYAPGTLTAMGYKDGKAVGRTKDETTGLPEKVILRPDQATLKADGEDVSVIAVGVMDPADHIVPATTNLVTFELQGPGRIIGVGNGDPSCHEPDVFVAQPVTRPVPVKNWRWTRVPDARRPGLPEIAEKFDDSAWKPIAIETGQGPLADEESGVFRAKLTLTEADLAHSVVELSFRQIDDDGWVYVNGKKAGESHDWSSTPEFDVKSLLHPGENTIAVAVANQYGAGGVNLGVTLRLQDNPPPPQWQRSIFNGLAQIIVQTTKEPGEITLKARSAGLTGALVTLHSQACTPRPSVP